MPILTNPTLHLAKPGERWRKDPLKTGGTITALMSHHARMTGGVGRQLLPNEQLALEIANGDKTKALQAQTIR